MEYKIRNNAFENDTIWKLENDCLVINNVIRIPYNEISSVRLFYHPTRFKTKQYMCEVKGANFKYKISSVTYKSVANFNNNAEEYNKFIAFLFQSLKDKNPKCVFKTGNTILAYISHIIIMFFVLVVLYFALSFIGGVIFIKLIIMGFYFIYSVKSLIVNKPKIITENELPEKVLAKY